MHRNIAVAAALSLFACSAKQAVPTPDLPSAPQLAVFHTERGVYAVPVAIGASSWKSESARIEADADNDGIPASLDENEAPASCAAAAAFHLDIRGDKVALTGARVVARSGDVATVLSPFGDVRLALDPTNTSVQPGAHVNVVGLRDVRSPLDTVKVKTAVILCDAPASSAFALLPVGAQRIGQLAGNPSRAPLSAMRDVTELAQR